jgi:hypothetical protein
MGCGLGCLGVAVVGISSCIGFQVWINTPGELLEPAALLDPQAVGWAEVRLDLEDAETEALADALIAVARPPEGMFEGSPVLGFLTELNARRQERQLRRLFPMTASWTLYPGEPGELDQTLISASVPRMSHTLTLIDWGLGFVARREPEMPTELYRGERVLRIDEPDRSRVRRSRGAGGIRIETESELGQAEELEGEGGEGEPVEELDPQADEAAEGAQRRPVSLRVFLRDVGIFFATSDPVVRRAIDRLDGVEGLDGLEGAAVAARPSRLATLLAGLDEAPIRAAVVNDGTGRLARVLDLLLDHGVLDQETRALLDDVESATLIGRFGGGGEIELTLTLAGLEADAASIAVLEAAAQRLIEEHRDLETRARVEPTRGGVVVHLTLPLAEAAERAVDERRVIVR